MASPWFEHIKKNRKTIEGRLNKNRFSELQKGSILIIKNNDNDDDKNLVAVVTRIRKYPDFKTYLTQEGLARTLPGVMSIEEGVAVYRQFYNEENERTYGVLAVHIRLI